MRGHWLYAAVMLAAICLAGFGIGYRHEMDRRGAVIEVQNFENSFVIGTNR